MQSNPVNRLLFAKGLRAFGDGFVALLLPLYLLELGFTPLQVGWIATTTLLGSGLLTLLVGRHAHAADPRTLLLAACLLMGGTGLGFALVEGFWPLMLVALVGTLNPSGGDVSVFLPLEHSMLAREAQGRQRTATFARYSVVGSLAGACGSLAAAGPTLLAAPWQLDQRTAFKAMFLAYALIAVASALVYRGLPAHTTAQSSEPRAPLGPSRKRVYVLAALFSLDAFAGGLVVQSLLALWLYQRFGLSLQAAGTLFFWSGLLAAFSFVVAARIAERIGLVNTMVFTHIPANLCLLAIPFVPDLGWAIVLLLVRSALSQMDVPTRSSYVMAIVTPAERPAAASVTTVPRSLAAAASPALAGWLLSASPFGWPLVACAVLKITYDLLLLAMFQRVRPPEEAASTLGERPVA